MIYFRELLAIGVFRLSGAVQFQLHGGSFGISNNQGIFVLPDSIFKAFGRLRHYLGSVGLDFLKFCLMALVNLGQPLFEAGDLGVLSLRRNLGIAGIYSPLGYKGTSGQS